MKNRGDGTFSFTFIPNDIFTAVNIPAGRKIEFMQFKIVKTIPGNIVPSLDETVEDALQLTSGFFVVRPIVD